MPFDDAEHAHLHADRAPWQRLTREEARLVLRHVPERDLELVLCVWLGGEKVTDFVDRAHPGMPARERARLANTLGHRLLRYGALLRAHL